jgi:hypothetical protein
MVTHATPRCAACLKTQEIGRSAKPLTRCPRCDTAMYCDTVCLERNRKKHSGKCRLARVERGWVGPGEGAGENAGTKVAGYEVTAGVLAKRDKKSTLRPDAYRPPGGWEAPRMEKRRVSRREEEKKRGWFLFVSPESADGRETSSECERRRRARWVRARGWWMGTSYARDSTAKTREPRGSREAMM